LLPKAGHLGYKMNMVTNKIKRKPKTTKKDRIGNIQFNKRGI
jgi:hypothetical protein